MRRAICSLSSLPGPLLLPSIVLVVVVVGMWERRSLFQGTVELVGGPLGIKEVGQDYPGWELDERTFVQRPVHKSTGAAYPHRVPDRVAPGGVQSAVVDRKITFTFTGDPLLGGRGEPVDLEQTGEG